MILLNSAYGHDLIEDARVSYNDIVKALHRYDLELEPAAEIIRAVTNYSRGRNREERMPDFVYQDIRNTEHADFIKLCDRLANVRYSIFTRSSMTRKYKAENNHFIESVTNRPEELDPLIGDLINLFNE